MQVGVTVLVVRLLRQVSGPDIVKVPLGNFGELALFPDVGPLIHVESIDWQQVVVAVRE
jgi:hypothetical protein